MSGGRRVPDCRRRGVRARVHGRSGLPAAAAEGGSQLPAVVEVLGRDSRCCSTPGSMTGAPKPNETGVLPPRGRAVSHARSHSEWRRHRPAVRPPAVRPRGGRDPGGRDAHRGRRVAGGPRDPRASGAPQPGDARRVPAGGAAGPGARRRGRRVRGGVQCATRRGAVRLVRIGQAAGDPRGNAGAEHRHWCHGRADSTTALPAAPKAKGDDATDTAGALTPITANPRRISAPAEPRDRSKISRRSGSPTSRRR